jgi:hypothetical protein
MFIYAVNEDYEFRTAPDSGPRPEAPLNAVKHETLFHNAHVRAAGEVQIQDGIIVDINDLSGSYGTRAIMNNDPQFSCDVLEAIVRGNIPASDVVLAKLRNLGGLE